ELSAAGRVPILQAIAPAPIDVPLADLATRATEWLTLVSYPSMQPEVADLAPSAAGQTRIPLRALDHSYDPHARVHAVEFGERFAALPVQNVHPDSELEAAIAELIPALEEPLHYRFSNGADAVLPCAIAVENAATVAIAPWIPALQSQQ